MNPLPFHLVTLSHSEWDVALAYAKHLGEDALPELRLDLFPEVDPEGLVDALKRRCLVTCRRVSEGGRWPDEDESGRLAQLVRALPGRPQWLDLEWDQPIPPEIQAARMMVLHAAWMMENVGHKEARDEISMIKFVVANTMLRVVDRALQVHGGLGVTDDTILAFWYRHERAARIYDGADEVHKASLARRILQRYENKVVR